MTLLRGTANRVETAEARRPRPLAVRARDGRADLLADRQRFPGQHRGLIGNADSLEVCLGVEPGRNGAGKRLHERRGGKAAFDVVAQQPSFAHVAHDQVVATVRSHLGGGGLRLLVLILAVNEGGKAVARVGVDPLPDIQHRPAGRVDENAADLTECGKVVDGHPKRGHDHDVVARDAGEVERSGRFGTGQNRDAHLPQALVDVRVMDDLANQVDGPVGELAASLIRVIDRALDPVAEPELTSQSDRDVPNRDRMVVRFQQVDDPAVVICRKLVLDLGFEPEPPSEIRRRLSRSGHGCKSKGALLG